MIRVYLKYLCTNILGLKIKPLMYIFTTFIAVNTINEIFVVAFDLQVFVQ